MKDRAIRQGLRTRTLWRSLPMRGRSTEPIPQLPPIWMRFAVLFQPQADSSASTGGRRNALSPTRTSRLRLPYPQPPCCGRRNTRKPRASATVRHAGYVGNELGRHRLHSCKEDPERRARRRDIGVRPVRRERGIERLYDIDQTMRFEAGQRDAREVEGVDPSVFQKGVPARMTCGERSVKSDVVRHDLGGSDKLDKRGQRLLRQRSIRHVLIMDVREVGDIFRNRLTRIHERDEPFSDLAALHARRSDLRQLVMVEGEARGLGVQDDDIGVQLTIIGFRGPRREMMLSGVPSLTNCSKAGDICSVWFSIRPDYHLFLVRTNGSGITPSGNPFPKLVRLSSPF